MRFSILVPAHNEAHTIDGVLRSLLLQPRDGFTLSELVVIASGCTDDTVARARALAGAHPEVRVVAESSRRGKAAAINDYLCARDPHADVSVLCSADLHVSSGTLAAIARSFREAPELGMVGGRPVPDNDPSTFLGRMVCQLWELHHRVALQRPKLGELVAFRSRLVQQVTDNTSVDEASIEHLTLASGFRLGYLPDAVVHNHGPEDFSEYFEQRCRIHRGHSWLSRTHRYRVATLQLPLLLRATLSLLREQGAFGGLSLAALVCTEIAARVSGSVQAITRGSQQVWRPLPTTKRLRLHHPVAPVASTAEPTGS